MPKRGSGKIFRARKGAASGMVVEVLVVVVVMVIVVSVDVLVRVPVGQQGSPIANLDPDPYSRA